MEAVKNNTLEDSNEVLKSWFDKTFSNLSVDRMMVETNTASEETSKFYKDLAYKRYDDLHSMARSTSTVYFIKNLLFDFLNELKSFNTFPKKLAFDFSDAKILVWAEIKDSDDKSEDALILAEARANAKYSENGFYVSSTIVEESDHLPIPSHYHEIAVQ